MVTKYGGIKDVRGEMTGVSLYTDAIFHLSYHKTSNAYTILPTVCGLTIVYMLDEVYCSDTTQCEILGAAGAS